MEGFQGDGSRIFWKGTEPGIWKLGHPEAEANCEINNVQLLINVLLYKM